MEVKASFAHATKDLRTMGSQGLTALVRKRNFFYYEIRQPEHIHQIGHQNLDHNHLQETHLTKHNFLPSALKCDVFNMSDHKEVKIHPKHLLTLH